MLYCRIEENTLQSEIRQRSKKVKEKAEFTVRLDSALYKKLRYVSSKENNNLNNHMLHMIRQNVQYYEKVHGRINVNNIKDEDLKDE